MAYNWLLMVLLATVFTIAWIVCEFKSTKPLLRCAAGILAIIMLFAAWAPLASFHYRIDYNAEYSFAADELLNACAEGLAAGESDLVLQELLELREEFVPDYRRKGNFAELARDTAKRIEAGMAAAENALSPERAGASERDASGVAPAESSARLAAQ